ncbi:MAG: PKD domain-containing protein, partial [Bacteroidales bacterium]|nr:PKD domain-containing protein [Bacteroidales bacterium]
MRIIFFTVLLHICTIIYSQLSSSFTSNKSVGCGSTAIQFDGNASTGYDRFAWNFGNGQTNTNSLKPIVLFEPGSYEVTFTVYNGTASKSSSMKIEIYTAPSGIIEFVGKHKGCRNDNFKFRAAITDGDTSKMTVNWIYGDGYKGTGKTMSHTYEFTNPYGFPLVMELIDENKCTYKTYQYVSISDKPQIEFNNDQSLFCDSLNVPLSITPNALVGVDSIIWQIDGEKVYDTMNFVHTFKDYGEKLVTVTVVDDNGCRNSVTDTIEILDIKAKIGIKDSVCVGQRAEFTQDASSADRYTWYFEDGSTTDVKSPTKIMNNADSSYMVILEASNGECKAYDTITFSVSSAIASFEMDTSWFCDFPGNAKFTNTSEGNFKKVLWRYNKNQTSSQDSPSLSINQTGYIYLNVTGNNNCVTKDSAYFDQKRP